MKISFYSKKLAAKKLEAASCLLSPELAPSLFSLSLDLQPVYHNVFELSHSVLFTAAFEDINCDCSSVFATGSVVQRGNDCQVCEQ